MIPKTTHGSRSAESRPPEPRALPDQGGAAISTIKEIAKRANVSIGTVDRVLHRRGRVSKSTEAVVRRIIEETGYRPNIFAKQLKLSRTFRFGVLMPKSFQDSRYWALPIRGIQRAQRELSSQRIAIHFFYYDRYSEASFTKVAREILRTPLDGLLVAPLLSEPCERFLRELPPEIPFVFFDSFIPDVDYVSYIGQDAFQSGRLSARLMQMIIKGAGSVAAIRIVPGDYHINDRVNGFTSYCDGCHGIALRVYEMDPHRGAAHRRRLLAEIVHGAPDLKGIFISNASTHLVAEYVKSHSPNGGIHIIGYDPIEENIRYLKDGVIDFLISQQSERQGLEGITALFRYVVLKEPVPKNIMMQLDIATRENIDYYQS